MDQEQNLSALQEQFDSPKAEEVNAKTTITEQENATEPVQDSPAVEALAAETPAEETPAAEAPAEEISAAEAPAAEAPAEEAPAEEVSAVEEAPAAEPSAIVDYTTFTEKELLAEFERLIEADDKTELHKNAETIKSCFYKLLLKNKPDEDEAPVEEGPAEVAKAETTEEITFKRLYARYKVLRADLMRNLEQQKEKNLEDKLAIIEGIKELLEKQEDINYTFPEFRSLQLRWKEVGPVPLVRTKDVWESYQHCVEKFYDYVKINNELRDLDFKHNLELKEQICGKAEALVEEPGIISAFHKLQKLHEEWREIGPIARELREQVWDRFKAATTAINKRHQEYFEEQKLKQKDNLDAKSTICEKAEAIANEPVEDGSQWNTRAKAMEALQEEWRTIGFASKKDNQRIYDRFRAACDKFYNAKRDYYSGFKNEMRDNMAKKVSLCEQAEALMQSDDWRKTTDQLIALQKQWKEVGPVPRKQAEAVWKRFRVACDDFFTRKSKHFSGVDANYEENLAAKEALIKEIEAFSSEGAEDIAAVIKDFQAKWNAIGFVPIKEKERIQAAYKAAMDKHFGEMRASHGYDRRVPSRPGRGKVDDARNGREKLIQRFRQLESDITVWENNMGFFAKSKNADKIIADTCKKIEQAKVELAELEEKIKQFDKQFE